MQKLEKFLIVFSVIGVIINLFSDGGGEVLILIGMTLLGALYLIFGFALFNNIDFRDIFKKSSYLEINMRRIILSAVFGIAFFGLVFGILFRLLGFEGAFELLALSLILTAVLFFLLLVRFYYKRITISTYFKNIMYRLVPYSVIGLVIVVEIVYNYYYG